MKWFVHVEFFKGDRRMGEITGEFDAQTEASAKNKALKMSRGAVFKGAKHVFRDIRITKS
jgi:hypothetical protein